MEQIVAALAVGISFALMFALGRIFFGGITSALMSRLRGVPLWLAMLITALISFAAFLVVQPLVVDQPRTPLWYVLGFTAVALLVSGATATAKGLIELGWAIERHLHARRTRPESGPRP